MSDYGIKTYADLAETCCGMVLANEIASRPLEPVFYDAELGLYVWGITHFGTSWDYVPAPEIH